ncbi:MAG TPA: hypothetical protein VKB53_13930 [Gammaproteobacteria bacterium]|nr:hypothetical protein [Gammaproteobacteria bacterium]
MTHTISFGLNRTVDITDIANLGAEAQAIADLLRAIMYVNFTITDWGIKEPNGSTYYSAPLATPRAGTHTAATGAQDLFSTTVTLTGKGDAIAPGVCTGQFRSVIYVGAAYEHARGTKKITVAGDLQLGLLVARLNASVYVGADFYGQTGQYRGLATVQYNAHTQKHAGS